MNPRARPRRIDRAAFRRRWPPWRRGARLLLLCAGLASGLDAQADDYDVAPDGRRFVAIQTRVVPPPTQLHLVAGWFDEIRRGADPRR